MGNGKGQGAMASATTFAHCPLPIPHSTSVVFNATVATQVVVKLLNTNLYEFVAASYSARNVVGCAPVSPGTVGTGSSNDFFSSNIAFEIIGSMKIGLPFQ